MYRHSSTAGDNRQKVQNNAFIKFWEASFEIVNTVQWRVSRKKLWTEKIPSDEATSDFWSPHKGK
jgi:hypothetical protein